MWQLIDSMPNEARVAAFNFGDDPKLKETHWQRDKNLRDLLIHLCEWHRLLLNWTAANLKGETKPFLPEPYNWKTYGDMNAAFWEKHQATSYDDAVLMLRDSHANVMALIESLNNDELFEKKHFPWTGTTNVGSYCISVTASHYDWAIKKLKLHSKTYCKIRSRQMPKYRKMLSDINTPYLHSLMRLIETQSKTTLAHWCLNCAREYILPIYEKTYPGDARCRHALDAAVEWLDGKVKLPYVKNIILNECHAAAREAEGSPAAQAAARTCGQAAATIHAPTHSLGLALYGALAIAYDKLGVDADWNALLSVAADECAKMEAALRAVAVENEPNPAKINWNC